LAFRSASRFDIPVACSPLNSKRSTQPSDDERDVLADVSGRAGH